MIDRQTNIGKKYRQSETNKNTVDKQKDTSTNKNTYVDGKQSIDITTTSEIEQAEKEYTDRQKDRLRINRQINRHSGQTCKIDRNRMNTHK